MPTSAKHYRQVSGTTAREGWACENHSNPINQPVLDIHASTICERWETTAIVLSFRSFSDSVFDHSSMCDHTVMQAPDTGPRKRAAAAHLTADRSHNFIPLLVYLGQHREQVQNGVMSTRLATLSMVTDAQGYNTAHWAATIIRH